MAGPRVHAGIGDWLSDAWDSITGVTGSVVEGLSLASDPLGWTFNKAQQAVDGLVSQLLPWLMTATKPDLTLDWFITQYKISFGIAVMIWLLILLGRLMAVARGNASGGDLIELLTTRSMTFIAGAMWGPAAGWMIVGIFHALSEGLLGLIGSSAEGALTSLQDLIRDDDWLAVPGGLFFGIGLMITMLVSLTLVVVMLIIAMVALYLSGVIFPIGWVWVTDDPSRRPIAYKIAWTWLGLNAAHPLMFLLLGASFALIAGMVPMSTDRGIKLFTHSLMAVVVMIMTALSPVMLFKFAPVLPTNAGQSGPTLNSSGGAGGKQGGGSNNIHEAIDNAPSGSGDEGGDDSAPASEGGGSSGSNAGASAPAEDSPGPLEQAAMSSPSGSGDSSSGTGTSGGDDQPSVGGGEGEGASPSSGEGAEGAGTGDAPSAGEETGTDTGGPTGSTPIGHESTSAASEGTPDTAGAGAQGESSAAGTSSAAETAGTAGAAETATGAGAVVGIPTLIAAAGMAAAEKTVAASEQGAAMAATDMDDKGDSQ